MARCEELQGERLPLIVDEGGDRTERGLRRKNFGVCDTGSLAWKWRFGRLSILLLEVLRPGSQDWKTKEKQTERSLDSWLRRPERGKSAFARSLAGHYVSLLLDGVGRVWMGVMAG
jgi:hypothetical protein